MKGSGALLWMMASCMAAAIAADGDWKPFAYLSPDENPLSDLNLSTSLSLSPKIQIQSVYSEGLGWETSHPSLADSPAMHVILTLTGKDPRPEMIGSSIPLGSQKVYVKSQFTLPCIVEEGNGDFDDCHLGPKTARAFRTNAMGRVSFSIPTDALMSLENPFPPIFVQTQFMESSQWMVAHIDAQLMQKLSKMTPDHILTLQPDISPVTASAVSASVASLMSLSHGAMPDASRTMGEKDSRRLQARNSFSGLTYDSEKNIQSSYLIRFDDSTDMSSSTLFTRSLPQVSLLNKREIVSDSFLRSLLADNETCILTDGCSPILEKREYHVLSSPTDQDTLVLLGKRDSNELMLFSRADKQHPWKQQLINKLEHAWATVIAMFKGIGISIKKLFKSLEEFFAWEKISNTVAFLSLFYRKLAPLSIKGLDIIRDRYLDMYRNATKSTDAFFMQRLENLGVSNLNFESSQAKAFQFKNGTKGPTEEPAGPIEADAKTLLIHDRIVNNIPNISMNPEGKGIFERIIGTLEKGGASLVDALDVHELKKLMPHHLEFHSTASIKKMGLAKMINILRSVALGSEQLFGNVFAALMQLVPVYWNLAEAIMMFPLKIPFVYNWWSRKFGGRSSLSLLDILCALGGVYATWQYAIYYKGQGPFTSTDIEVLDSAKNPELLLFTWNHDPRTSAVGNKALQDHRLGIYDWVQKCHVVVVWSLMNGLYDLALIGEDLLDAKFPHRRANKKETSIGSPSGLTYVPQVMNSLFEMIGPIAQYPFTQLETDDEEIMRTSLENPDHRYLGFWYSWVMELFTKAIRPFLGEDNKWNNAPLRPMIDLILVGAPTTLFALKIQVDMGKDVAPHDYPRQAVVAIGWFEIFGYYFEALLPFVPGKAFGPQGELVKKYILISKHAAINVANAIKNNIMIGYHIVGMLSSSFQPKDAVEETPTTVAQL